MITESPEMQSPSHSRSDGRWRAVVERDVRADGTFVYAVSSTGIYCRPSCPSRRPREDRVRYFPTPAVAARAGFRPCRRCRPDGAASPPVARVERVRAWIDAHPDERPVLAKLATVAGVSPWHLQRHFTRLFGLSPRQYAAAARARRLKADLRAGKALTGALYDAGYGSPSRLYEEAPAVLGMSPRNYQRGGAGQSLRYVVTPSAIGPILVAASAKGLCRIAMDGTPEALVRGLAQEYPRAELVHDPKGLSAVARAVAQLAAGRPASLPVPLDVRGTAFQRRVWRALQEIPPGETRTYAEVAGMIGRPSAARAVAGACAANAVALAVPCHRVVPASGGPGGYRWGPGRKAALLRAERNRLPVDESP